VSATSASIGWDCHAHVFGPYAQFPLAPDSLYAPPEAPESQYLALLARLGLGHGVLVNPSMYAHDHSLLLHTLQRHANLRGIAVVRPGSGLPLAGLRERGVRATRFSQRTGAAGNFPGSASFEDLEALGPALADAGLHAEIWTDCEALLLLAERIRSLPVPLVIDHMGSFDVQAGVDDPGFRSLLALLETGRVWVKLCAYRNLLKVPLEAGRPFHEALVRANADRLVWGSDWPHLRVEPAPDAGDLLALFRDWVGDADVAGRILHDNAEALYR
jgi:predicted TIM-barrel fold metal-dependent hydrolase